MQAERARKFCENITYKRSKADIFLKNWHFFPNSREEKFRFMSSKKRTDYLFSAFSRSEYLFPKMPGPSESNDRLLKSYIVFTKPIQWIDLQ